MGWWRLAAKMWDPALGVLRGDGEVINRKSCSMNAERVSLREAMDLFQTWQAEGWDTVALWMEEA